MRSSFGSRLFRVFGVSGLNRRRYRRQKTPLIAACGATCARPARYSPEYLSLTHHLFIGIAVMTVFGSVRRTAKRDQRVEPEALIPPGFQPSDPAASNRSIISC